MNIGFVIDSTIDLPKEVIDKYDIKIVSLDIIWGEKTYKDRINMQADEFFDKLKTTTIHPRSSAPSAGDFVKTYTEMLQKGKDLIISLHISSKMSGTYQAASIAASMVSKDKIIVLDSSSVSIGTGIKLLKILKNWEKNQNIEEIKTIALANDLDIFFVVDDLNYLYKGGRIGAAQKVLGGLLNIKPLLGVENGVVVAKEKIIGEKNIIKKFEQILNQWKRENKKIDYIGIAYSNSKDQIKPLSKLASTYFPGTKTFETQIGPVVGCHAGPGLIALAAY